MTVAATRAFVGSRSWNVLPLIVAAFIALLKVAVTFVPTATPEAPLAGETEVTVGGLPGAVVLKTTSTQ